ncbi:MAG: hypothetical protein N2558_03635 [Patescibacteria group bacterium]|nr:hypothetical protein [Patescibacteria group bacterium]
MNKIVSKRNVFSQKESKFSKIVFYTGIVFLLLFLSSFFKTLFQYFSAINIVSKYEQKVQVELDKQSEIKEKLKETDDFYFAEKMLRDKLGMARQGEIVVVLPSEDELRKIVPRLYDDVKEEKVSNWEMWLKIFYN